MALGQIHGRYSRFILNGFKNSKIGVPTQQSCSRFCQWNPYAPLPPSVLFNKKTYDEEKWFHNSKGVGFTIFLFSIGAAIGILSSKRVTVPYTERRHFILFYKFLAEFQEEELMPFEGEPELPPHHPDSIKARRIFEDIIDQALPLEMEIRRELEKENKLEINVSHEEKKSLTKAIILRFTTWNDHGEKQSVEKDKCKIIVVDSAEAAVASGGVFGKLYATSTILHHYRKHDPMIANLFAHEVGHDLARHTEEIVSKFISTVCVIGTSLYLFWQSTYIRSRLMPFRVVFNLGRRRFLPSLSLVSIVTLLTYPLTMKYWRDMILEADYIGLMLASSAGYNPVVGVVYPVFGIEFGESVLPEFVCSVPSGKRRSRHLSNPKILNEAIYRYRQKPHSDITKST